METRVLHSKEVAENKENAAREKAVRRFLDKIDSVKKMHADRYAMKASQALLMNEMCNGIYLNACHDTFCYGFYQGMQYMKNQNKKKRQAGMAKNR